MSIRILNAQGILSSDVPTGKLLWVDQVNGIDALAARGRLTVPFKTLTEAKEAASDDDTIMVMPGTYAEKNLLKDKVNWYFLPGAKVDCPGSAPGAIFDTSVNGTNAAVKSVIGGYGEFVASGSHSTCHVVKSVAANSNLIIHAKRIQAFSYAAVVVNANDGTLKMEVHEEMVSGGEVVLISASNPEGSVLIQSPLLYTSGAACLKVDSGSVEFRARRLFSSPDPAVRVDGGSGSVVVQAYEINSENDPAVYYAATYGANLTLQQARIISGLGSSNGRAIEINSSSSSASKKVRLANCVLLPHASADSSIHALESGTKVQFHGYSVSNKSAVNVTPVGGNLLVSTDIS
jgi:hypothetical protein